MGSTNDTLPLKVAVVGSGLAGLLIAQGLRKNGIQAVVYERDPCLDHRVRDWTLMIHWGLKTIRKLVPEDVLECLRLAYCDPFYPHDTPPEDIPCFDGATGNVIYTLPTTEMCRVSRQRCRRVLSQGLDIRFGKGLATINEMGNGRIALKFEDSTSDEADVVIGADGPSSKTRECLLGPEVGAVKRAPWSFATASFTYRDAFKARFARSPHPLWAMAYDRSGICALAVQDVKSPDEPADWEFTMVRIWKGDTAGVDGPEALDDLKRRTRHFCEPFGSAARWIPDGSCCNVNQLRYWVPVPWDNRGGRVTLAGDAAHATLPFRGQGFNVTVDDALLFVDSIIRVRNGEPREQVMGEYDRDVVRRGRATVLEALEEGTKALNFDLIETKAATQGVAKQSVHQEVAPVAEG